MAIPWSEWWIVFCLGLLSGLLGTQGWHWLQGHLKLRQARIEVEAFHDELMDDPRDRDAQALVEACKQRLRWQLTLNPDWLTPLTEETPTLVRDIAAIYYPDADDPLRGPGLSHFIRAIHLTAADIADFLQTHRLGRAVDISADTLWKGWNMGRQIVQHERVQTLHKWYQYVQPWYKKVQPVLQVARYNSPWMWASFAASNVMIRMAQPMVIDIVARRAIELYSGRLAAQATDTMAQDDGGQDDGGQDDGGQDYSGQDDGGLKRWFTTFCESVHRLRSTRL